MARQTVPDQPKESKGIDEKPAMADYMQSIKDQLDFSQKVYKDGIPASTFDEIVEAGLRKGRIHEDGAHTRVVDALMAEGLIFEPRLGFYKVVI